MRPVEQDWERPVRAEVRDLADRLALEYTGAVPPGQVLAVVLRAARAAAAGPRRLRPEEHLELTEQIARGRLVRRVARG